jgi:hypothetical protein
VQFGGEHSVVDDQRGQGAGEQRPFDHQATPSGSIQLTLRFRVLSARARMVTHARRRILKIPPGWAWSPDLATAWDHLQALHPA